MWSSRTGQESWDKSYWDSDPKFCSRGRSDPAQTTWSPRWNETQKQYRKQKNSAQLQTRVTQTATHVALQRRHPPTPENIFFSSISTFHLQTILALEKKIIRHAKKQENLLHHEERRQNWNRKGAGHNLWKNDIALESESESEVAQSCPTLSNPMDCSLPRSSVHGVSQARVLKWGAIVFPA